VWDLNTFDISYSKHYHKTSKNLQAFKQSNKIMLVFSNDIIVIDSTPKQIGEYDTIPGYSLTLNVISDAKINHNEKLLGVATTSAAAPEVTLYQTEDKFIKLK